jgi:acyl carrier protein
MEITTRVRDFVGSELDKEKRYGLLKDTDSLIETGIIDSLGIMRLLAYLESEFSIRLADEDLVPENFETIQAIRSLVERKSKTRVYSS